MLTLHTIAELRAELGQARRAGRRIGLVPTMGALHAGHRSLIRAARGQCEVVVVSIFVNPTQFGPAEDFERYPRPLEKDLDACRAEGVDVAFCPSVEEVYPAGEVTRVTVSRLTEVLCGPCRPGHFEGVTTVVAKLINMVQPDVMYLGQKDAQQAVVLGRMVRDLRLPVDVVVCPTVREPDGLALSSRNAYLDAAQRRQATSLYAALTAARERIERGERDSAVLVEGMRRRIEGAGPCVIEYISIVDAEDLSARSRLSGRCLMALAVRIGATRLIDNVVLDVPECAR
ncbi:MAG: pantoate--beta-alanine ligase [Phycisphaerae bacterium]|nr:pantoate--beta-alanine ligase [Phycisphaerae bacterium]